MKLVSDDNNGLEDIYVRDGIATQTASWMNRCTGRLLSGQHLSGQHQLSGADPDQGCTFSALSFDGRFVTFRSFSTNLVTISPPTSINVYVRDDTDRDGILNEWGALLRASYPSHPVESRRRSIAAHRISSNGRFVVFPSLANSTDLPDTNGLRDIFLRDLQAIVVTTSPARSRR